MRIQHLLDFYRLYQSDYWLNKLLLLRNAIVHYEEVKPHLHDGAALVDDESFLRMLKMELHFMYFQIIEALFDMIFAIEDDRDEILWYTLSFSNWTDYGKRIRAIADGSSTIFSMIKRINDEVSLPFVQYLFFLVYQPFENEEQKEANLKFSNRALRVFAYDYSDRGDYNAFKHSLRLYHSGFKLGVGIGSTENLQLVGSADDAITYLEKDADGRVRETTKSFDPERDFRMSCMCYRLICNLINSRKHAYLDIEGKCLLFDEEDFDAANERSFTVGRTSFTID